MKIQKNVGETDKKIRIILGVISVFLATQVSAWPRWVLLILGVSLILTGLFQFCGLYTLFGVNTGEKK
jgi:predicted phage tail protein